MWDQRFSGDDYPLREQPERIVLRIVFSNALSPRVSRFELEWVLQGRLNSKTKRNGIKYYAATVLRLGKELH